MIRVVIDTNVFVSSFLSRGMPWQVIRLWRDEKITLCLSGEIVDEYVAVLRRLLGEDAEEIRELLELFERGYQTVFAAHPPELSIVDSDPADDKFIACAVALDAEVIVTGDKDLLSIGRYFDIDILSPRAFFEKYARP